MLTLIKRLTSKSLLVNSDGDTLIEVTIATIIMSVILFSAFTLGSKAFQLGQNAKERTQATQIIQTQAEGLRALRDNLAWSAFKAQVKPKAQAGDFHIERTAGVWTVQNGRFDPQDNDAELADGRYSVWLSGGFVNSGAGVSEDMLDVTITVEWARFGNGPLETSNLRFKLTDTGS